ncbi:MAG: metallophosphoesterase family protein [Gammaproteobacteria bacterium]
MTTSGRENQISERIAIVSDTHAQISPDVLAVVESCSMVVHAGDICGKNVLDLLHASSKVVVAVRGNNDVQDLWANNEADTVNALPRVAELQLPGGKLVVEHGHLHGMISPDHNKLRMAHPQANMIVYGHTHKRIIDKSASPWVVNPGAAGNVRNGGGPCCLVLEASEQSWAIKEFQF